MLATDIAYRPPARVLHWLTVLLVLPMIPAGILIANVEDFPSKNTVYDLHRSTGFVVLCLAVLRLAYRLTHRPPPLPPHMPGLQRFAAEAVHWALYGFMIAAPLAGWAASNAFGAQVSVFWLFNLPNIVPKDEALFKIFIQAHRVLTLAFAATILVHFAGAMFHTFVQRDGILRRMWPA